MDARTGVQRQQPSKPAWIVSGQRSSPAADAVAIADEAAGTTSHAAPAEERRSLDPLRSTDRYRLVMPYAEEV
ncbi:MAG: hypothetical protein JNM25_08760 [Planctomycetes bacterium]|nr:hypothetical protein [Planctomycetota bacterium]